MVRYAARRLLIGATTLLAVSLLVFCAVEALPGGVAERILGRNATPQAVADLSARLGLDRPFLERYLSWLGDFIRGDFGPLTTGISGSGATVNDLIANEGRNSLILAVVTLVALVPLVLLVGSISAVRAGGALDTVVSAVSFIFLSVPEFVVGTVLIYLLSVWLHVLPPLSLLEIGQSPLDRPRTLVLPVLTLLVGLVAFAGRFLRAGMIDILGSEFVASARLNGFPERRVVWRVALRSALVPTVQVLAMLIPYLVGGVVLVETVFSYPGIGSRFAQAVLGGDVRVVQAIAVLGAAVTIGANIVSDLVVMVLVPKLRTGGGR